MPRRAVEGMQGMAAKKKSTKKKRSTTSVPKKAGTKKVSAKKVSAKKVSSKKKAASTKSSAKRSVTKSAAKKSAARKSVVKKSAVRKSAVKRTTAKKAVSKQATQAKKSVKRSVGRKGAASRKATPSANLPKLGQIAPDFELMDQDGVSHRLSDYQGQRVVVYFYPKDDTPGCTKEACGFRDAQSTFQELGVQVFGISPDSIEDHEKFVKKFSLNFPLLADRDHAVAELYGVWGEKKFMGRTYDGIHRTTFVVEASGRIGHIFEKVKADGHEGEVLELLQADG